MSPEKARLDVVMVQRGLVETRARAQALILEGKVRVDGKPVDKPGRMISPQAQIEIIAPLPYVSRGGIKLAAALDTFQVNPAGWICADVGASTGGFTDCLLQRGAARVFAIDVGYGELAWSLRNDPRVVVLERTNARYLPVLPGDVRVNLVTVDVSFISLRLILPVVKNWLRSDGRVIALIKPQFEAGRAQVGRGGVVKDPAVHREVLRNVLVFAQDLGLSPQGIIPSPIRGPAGNVEFLAYFRLDMPSMPDMDDAVDKCVAMAHAAS
ncbi:MAG: TlyA family RNA methyltransferase [Anaerolineae bacterium]|nr:TlyA family RNA methyltransferase [Anaerolineae bacterium]MDW8099267.1 TlyA family RNA methyltransferase [Anaerolineae bacterium]